MGSINESCSWLASQVGSNDVLNEEPRRSKPDDVGPAATTLGVKLVALE